MTLTTCNGRVISVRSAMSSMETMQLVDGANKRMLLSSSSTDNDEQVCKAIIFNVSGSGETVLDV